MSNHQGATPDIAIIDEAWQVSEGQLGRMVEQFGMIHRRATCPECTAGKHGNCDGTSWDEVTDAPAPCPCATGGHS